MNTVVHFEGFNVDVFETDSRVELVFRFERGKNSEVEVKWGKAPVHEIVMRAYDRREKSSADYRWENISPNADKINLYVSEQLPGFMHDKIPQFYDFLTNDLKIALPTFRYVKVRKPRVKKIAPAPVIEVPKPKKRKRAIRGEAFRCERCFEMFSVKKATDLDDGRQVCVICAAVVRAEEFEGRRAIPIKATRGEFKWYVLSVTPTQEAVVRRRLLRHVKANPAIQNSVKRILIATNKVAIPHGMTRTVKGIERTTYVKNKKSFNGYLLIQMIYNEETERFFGDKARHSDGAWGLLPKRPVVTLQPSENSAAQSRYEAQLEEFLRWRPTELTEEEAKTILLNSNKVHSVPKPVQLSFKVGDKIVLGDGKYDGMQGVVTSITGEKFNPQIGMKILVLGQPINIEVPFSDVQCKM